MQETANDPNIISFDCTAHAAKCHDLEISSFPDVRVYHRDGRMDVYSGARKRREYFPLLIFLLFTSPTSLYFSFPVLPPSFPRPPFTSPPCLFFSSFIYTQQS